MRCFVYNTEPCDEAGSEEPRCSDTDEDKTISGAVFTKIMFLSKRSAV